MQATRVDGVRRRKDAEMAPSSRAWFVNGAHCHSTFDFFRSILSLRFGANGGLSALNVPWSRTTSPPASLEAIVIALRRRARLRFGGYIRRAAQKEI